MIFLKVSSYYLPHLTGRPSHFYVTNDWAYYLPNWVRSYIEQNQVTEVYGTNLWFYYLHTLFYPNCFQLLDMPPCL